MKKLYIAAVLLLALSGCGKSAAPIPDNYNSGTNFEAIATSTGTFNMSIIQIIDKTKEQFTEFTYQPISKTDQKLLLAPYDRVIVRAEDATAPVHLVLKYKGKSVYDETTQSDQLYDESFGNK